MNLRKLSLTFLIITLGAASAYAKKQPKYEQAHQLTPEQAQLVERAVQREKVLIKNIQLRTPLVETYIQNTRPDTKLYLVPTEDQYMLSRVDFSKTFNDKAYQPRGVEKKGFFKNSLASITGLTKALHLDTRFTYNPTGFMQMMISSIRRASTSSTTCSAMCAANSWAPSAPGSTTFIPRSAEWAAFTAASGLKTRMATSSVSTAPTLAPAPKTIPATTSTSIAGVSTCSPASGCP